jgi:AraC family cel operon transcriptional repressor
MATPTLSLREFVHHGAAYHAARARLAPGKRIARHGHDFAEVFWIERGRGVHEVNGEVQALAPGDLVLMRAQDIHGFRSQAESLTQVNVAFDAATLDFLQERYFERGPWPWDGGVVPSRYRLDTTKLGWLAELAGLLLTGPPTRLVLERFLLTVLQQLVVPAGVQPGLPLWLREALRRLAEEPMAAGQSGGVSALATLAGRSREHVSRTARRATGRTATELIREARLQRAVDDLRTSDAPISAVALDCGIPNLSRFHRLFKARFGLTPRQYRLQHEALVRGFDLTAS